MFKTKEDALAYLRQCGKIILPSKFSYFCHSSQVQTDSSYENKAKFSKLWKELPTDEFVTNSNMSFLSQHNRLQYVAEQNSFEATPISYSRVEGQEGFQIKVMMPKENLTKDEYRDLDITDDDFAKIRFAYRGLGDGRHPKLAKNTQIYIFGYMNYDEMSGKEIKTVFGVREEDLIAYANEVQKEIAQMAGSGMVENSEYEMPDNNVGVSLKKETFVMGENLYKKEIEKVEIEEEIQQQDGQTETYNLGNLEQLLASEYSTWLSSDDPLKNRYRTIEGSREKRKEDRPTISALNSVRIVNGKVEIQKCNNASAQLRLYEMVKGKCQDLAKSVEGHLESKYGNYLQYAINDFCDLEILDSTLPEIEARLKDLQVYEKHVGKFIDFTIETQTSKRRGILGLFRMKEFHDKRRNLTVEEMKERKHGDLTKLNIALAEGKISQKEYERAVLAVEHLYEGYIIEKTKEEESNSENEAKAGICVNSKEVGQLMIVSTEEQELE